MTKHVRRLVFLTLSAGLLIGLTGCGGQEPLELALTGGGGPPQASPSGVESHTVVLRDWRFDAATVVLRAGTVLRFRNSDPDTHTIQVTAVAGGSPPFHSGEINPGQVWTYTFDTPGSYALVCVTPGPAVQAAASDMLGLVVVQ